MEAGKSASAEWASRPERSNMLMLRIMTWISLHLGRGAGRVVLHLIAGYFLLFASASRRASSAYLSRVLGRRARWRDIYKHFFWFASTIHDRIYLLNRRFDLFDIRIHGEELMRQALADGQGAFLIGAHMGSFEALRAIGRRDTSLKVVMAMYEENARKINAILSAISPGATQDVIGLGHLDSMLKIHEAMQQGAVVGMLADRGLADDSRVAVTMLGGEARLPDGPFRMAAIMRRPVLFMVGLYLGGNRYEVRFEKLADFSATPAGQRQAAIRQAVERYAQLMENGCRRAPYNWFNFFSFWSAPEAGRPTTNGSPGERES
ncbi:LpxL/LpxP family acyltransferase [Noviherbaspirillum aridicola]|uniref:Acyltransferase n=1 Tax=Noviherbaspirillum aridicola TaxID=2849687 RepID=A0ABQ4Q765_9BURK|nr:acyl-CoA synthetase [Noviherbaspirillum aridicola]GIZ52549.1 acyltransferase [Noviherbaspirillum aridicola]